MGTDVSTPVWTADTANFLQLTEELTEEVPPSGLQRGKHLDLIELCIYKSSMCKYGEMSSEGPVGVSGLCKWPFPEYCESKELCCQSLQT